MNGIEARTTVRRNLLTWVLPRRFFRLCGALCALLAVLALGSCGRNSAATSPVGERGAIDAPADAGDAPDVVENEAADHDLENTEAIDLAWNESARNGEFRSDYLAGETDPTTTAGQTVILLAAGDIANSGSGDTKTAALLDRLPGTIVTLGDNVYSKGTSSEFSKYYAPTWGRHRTRTRPTPGNHDYESSGAKPYYAYFGSNAGPSGRGYYSFNVGDWHIVSLNSNISMSSSSTQNKWLKADLATNRNRCTLAYWHHPRFSSGKHGSSTQSKGVYQTLSDAGAEIVLVGHDHHYERFAPMTADGKKDLAKGLRQFVVGTGGTSLRSVSSAVSNSEARNSSAHGVLKLTLAPGSYQWEFVPVSGKTYRDAGSGTCR